MSDLLSMEEVTFIDEMVKLKAEIDLTIDSCDFSITLPIDIRRMNKEEIEELINLLS